MDLRDRVLRRCMAAATVDMAGFKRAMADFAKDAEAASKDAQQGDIYFACNFIIRALFSLKSALNAIGQDGSKVVSVHRELQELQSEIKKKEEAEDRKRNPWA